LGEVSKTSPLRDPARGDFRPARDAAGKGVKVFVPWSLSGVVGGTPEGWYLDGAVDFLRIAQGTLSDADTTIEELYAWEFDGPQMRDFTGRKPSGPRNAGALEFAP
jgi:hypothetical protein